MLDPAVGSGAFLLGALERLRHGANSATAPRRAQPQPLRRGPERGRGPPHRAAALAGGHRRGSGRSRGSGAAAAQPRLPDPPGRQPVRAGGRRTSPAAPRSRSGAGAARASGASRDGDGERQARLVRRLRRCEVRAAGIRSRRRRSRPRQSAEDLLRVREARPVRRARGLEPGAGRGSVESGAELHALRRRATRRSQRARGALVPLSEPLRRCVRAGRLRSGRWQSAMAARRADACRASAAARRDATAGGAGAATDTPTGPTWPWPSSSGPSSWRPRRASWPCSFPPSWRPPDTPPPPATAWRPRPPCSAWPT